MSDGLLAPPTRHRAASTNRRPALCKRRSSSVLRSQTASPPPPPPPPPMLLLLLSRLLNVVHPKLISPWSASPMSASPEDVLPKSRNTFQAHLHVPILIVILLFPLSTALVFFCLYSLPISLSTWPRTLTDLATLGRELHGYSQSGTLPMAHVLGVMSIAAVWKHAWSIPGSVIWNVLAGALFHPALATLLLTTLTTLGSLCATLLSKPLAPFLTYFFPGPLAITRSAIIPDSSALSEKSSSSSAWVRLSVLRLIGVVPWSGINIACGVCGVNLSDVILGAFIGTLPWTAVTCQIGDILQTVASTPSPTPQTVSSLLTSPQIIFKLVFLSFLSLAPILARDQLKAFVATQIREERRERWSWASIQEWKDKIRLRSRERRGRSTEIRSLQVLVSEKEDAAERLP